jgi:hypothetical protein
MAALVQAHANNILDASMGTAAFTSTTTPLKVRLMTANGSGTAAGTEVTGGSYASQTVTFAAAASGSAASNLTVNFTLMPAVTVVGVELWDSTGTPARKWYGALAANKTLNSGDTFSVASGSLVASLS